MCRTAGQLPRRTVSRGVAQAVLVAQALAVQRGRPGLQCASRPGVLGRYVPM